MSRTFVVVILACVAACVAGSLVWAVTVGRRVASTDRVWAADHARAPRVEFFEDSLVVHDVRDFRWTSPTDAEERWRTEAYAMDDVVGVWLVLAPFAKRWRGLAHSFVSFELRGGRFLSVSVEARREHDEEYSLTKGVLRGFETIYVVGTEADLIGVRALRGDTLFLYPSRATPEQARAMFVDMLARGDELRRHPRFYNTLVDNCTTALRFHVNRVAPQRLPWGWGILLPGYSDALALEHGLLDTDLDIDGARRRFQVDGPARAALDGDRDGFGRRIRADMPPRGGP